MRVLRQMGIWALVFMMAGCVSPFAYKLIDPAYRPGTVAAFARGKDEGVAENAVDRLAAQN